MTADKIKLFTVWPNLSYKEPCTNTNCPEGGWHHRFQAKPPSCWPPGMTDPPQFDPKVAHLFKEDLQPENIKDVLKNLVLENRIEEETWKQIS